MISSVVYLVLYSLKELDVNTLSLLACDSLIFYLNINEMIMSIGTITDKVKLILKLKYNFLRLNSLIIAFNNIKFPILMKILHYHHL